MAAFSEVICSTHIVKNKNSREKRENTTRDERKQKVRVNGKP